MFKKAERKQAKLRLALAGPSGSGKTYSALLLAQGLGGRIAVLDTENGSASLYADLVDFDATELHAPYSPERYIEVIVAAELAGYDTLIIDSYSHEWTGSGGCLEQNETVAHQKFRGNTWAAWNETTPRHRKLTDKILTSSMHIICTMRSKTETVQGEGKKILKLGMKSEQRDGTDYEFTVVLDLTHDGHTATASKDRTKLFDQPELISEETGKRLLSWLNSGISPEERAKELLVDAIADIRQAADMAALESAYNAGRVIVHGFDNLKPSLVAAKEIRKAELNKARQPA
ncbi:AAA family ATPase [Pseudomonas sp. S10E 269]|uniref:ATP-binding protein n=1 Tax=unclassified Pseudomonas TaxID=196821 RepID=UPI000C25D414|nr:MULTISPECIES: ATP-binding protein [unclassified Pseudomonas]PJK33103.1 AAA family ATPase [Pseudomonas sp. S09F 262]PJK42596.1 AAA family ATPase [Pseudomonas sp. S10E 269]